jgi:hypothetical protein
MRKAVAFLVLYVGLAPAAHAQNQPPTAVIRTNPPAAAGNVLAGYSPMTVTFNSCRSSDPDGDPLKYAFDLDADGTFETIGTCRFTVTYHAATMSGKTVTACVDDRTNLDGHRICKSFYLFYGPEPEEETAAPKTLYAIVQSDARFVSREVVAAGLPPAAGDTLVKVDPSTGGVTVVGATGFDQTTALEAAPNGKLYATVSGETDATSGDVLALDCTWQILVEIDPATGAGSEVGPLFPGDGLCNEFDDLAFAGSTLIGLLDGYVYTINTATGQAALAVDEIDEGSYGGLADRAGTVYYGSSDDDHLFTVDVGGGSATPTGVTLDYTALTEIENDTLVAMTANNGTMHGLVRGYSILDCFAICFTASEVEVATAPDAWLLVEIDLGDGDVTAVADLGSTRVLGLAWSR